MSAELPLDRRIDRRAFVRSMAAVTAGGAVLAAEAAPARVRVADVELRDDAPRDLTELTAAEAATLIRRRRISPVELVDAHLERIERFDSTYLAFNLVLAERARARARQLERRRPTGPLHGVPIAIKDNFHTAGIRTTANSYIFEAFVPAEDATCVSRLTQAGAIVIGKTQMGPLATTRATTPDGLVTTVNAWTPHTPAYDPGGSSSGSATATAARLACSSIGTQTGGSITNPSNRQALTGLKPTLGRTSLRGIIPLSYTRDHAGPLARDARDAALLTQVMAGPDPRDPRTLGLPEVPDLQRAALPRGGRVRYPTTLGVPPDYTSGDTPAAAARRAMLDRFADLGVDVRPIALPAEFDLLTGSAFNNVRLPERTEELLEPLRRDLKLFGVSLNGWMQGLFLGGETWIVGQRAKLVLLRRILDDLFAQCDAVLQTSPIPFDIVGLPEIAFPIGFERHAESGRDVPIGAIVGAQPYAEDRLLALAGAYQAVTDWHLRRPDDPAALARAAAARRPRLTAEDVERTMQ